MLRFLLMQLLSNGAGNLTTEQATPALWGSPEESMANLEAKVPAPVDRITGVFKQLKNMHKDPALEQAMATPPPMSPFDVPMPHPRPHQAPHQMAQANPFQGLF